eukprot:XP_011674694.1 PREDICTED: kin of IRRE-like protein 1 [Strongylocentrotus purpuratus]
MSFKATAMSLRGLLRSRPLERIKERAFTVWHYIHNYKITFNGPPDSVKMTKLDDLHDGIETNVSCRAVNGYPAPLIHWYIGSRNVTYESSLRTSINEDDSYDAESTLTFTPKRFDHGKALLCQAFQSTTPPMRSTNYSIVLNISYANPPAFIFEWFCNGTRLSNVYRHITQSETLLEVETLTSIDLTIRNPQSEDPCNYKCVAVSRYGSGSAVFNTTFAPAPRLLSITDDRSEGGYVNEASVSITSGRTQNLTCSVQDARPPAELEWQVPGEVQILIDDQYNAVNGDAYTSRRMVSVTPSRDDGGKIVRCVASHQELGSGLQLFIRLDVQVPPSDLLLTKYGSITTNAKDSRSVSVFEYSATSFTCKSVGSRPTSRISWVIGSDDDLGSTTSMATTNEADQDLRDTNSTLQFIPKRRHHNQLLLCVASAGMNQRQTEVRVIVNATPRLLSITDDRSEDGYVNEASVSITSGRTQNLTCSVQDARPPAELEWQVPGEVQILIDNQYNAVNGDAYTSRRMVSVTPSRDDDGKIVRCVASHRELDSGLQLFIRLDVQGDYLTINIIP